MSKSPHDNEDYRISVIAKGDRGHSTNVWMSWKELRKRLSTPVVDTKHTLEKYLSLHIDKQNVLKDVGSFVGGPFKGGTRKGGSLIKRSILTLDIDSATPKQIKYLKNKHSDVTKYEFFGSTTRKHQAEKPRWRLVFPLSRAVTVSEYAPLARIIASKVFATVQESMDAIDDVSYRPAQIMYWPSVCKDALFETLDNRGSLLDPDEVLNDFGDWSNWLLLPFSDKRGQKRHTTGEKAEDPRTKHGIIGAFCRAYDVPSAIEEFLPDKYAPGDDESTKPRYTYLLGSSSNGAVIEDDGLFLYSHHGTDPCAERLVNAFDLVRIHLFGDYDIGQPADTKVTELPSFKEMVSLCRKDEAVCAELESEAVSLFSDLGDVDEEEEDPAPVKTTTDKKSKKEKSNKNQTEEPLPEPNMSILKHNRYEAPPFPLSILGPFWEERVKKWSNDKASPVDYAALGLIVGAASLIGNARRVKPRAGWTEPCILWGAVVGSPSSKKSPALDPISDALTKIESEWIEPFKKELRVWEADKRQAEQRRKVWESKVDEAIKVPDFGDDDSVDFGEMPNDCIVPKKPICRRAKINDTTMEALAYNLEGNPRGLLSVQDELSAWYASFTRYAGAGSSSDRAIWLQAYGGREYRIDRVKHLDAPVVIPRFSVSILGGLQPDKLRDFMKLSDDGLQARFIYAWPEPTYARSVVSEEEDNGAVRCLQNLAEIELKFDKNGKPDPVVLPLTDKAWSHFDQWTYDRMIAEKYEVGAIQGAFGKSDGLVARLALVLEHLWWCADPIDAGEPPEAVGRKAIKAAIKLREEYIKPMQIRVFAHGETSGDDADAEKIASWIIRTRPEMVNVKVIAAEGVIPGVTAHKTKRASLAIDTLVSEGWLIPQKIFTTGGRPRRDFTVNKRVYEEED